LEDMPCRAPHHQRTRFRFTCQRASST